MDCANSGGSTEAEEESTAQMTTIATTATPMSSHIHATVIITATRISLGTPLGAATGTANACSRVATVSMLTEVQCFRC